MPDKPQLRNRNRRQRGAAGVEAALVTMPFLMMILGIMNLGVGFFLNDMLHNRVREAGRYASLHPENVDQIKNVVLFGSTSAPPPPGETDQQTDDDSDDDDDDEIDGVPTPGSTGAFDTKPVPFLGITIENISVVRTGIGTDQERITVTVSGYQLPFFIPGFVRTLVGSPVVASMPVEKL